MTKKILRLTDHAMFNSVKEAAAASFITPSAISHALRRGGGATAGGHVWVQVDHNSVCIPQRKPKKKTPRPKDKGPRGEIEAALRWHEIGAIPAEEALERIRKVC